MNGRNGAEKEEESFTTATRAKNRIRARNSIANRFSFNKFLIGSWCSMFILLKSLGFNRYSIGKRVNDVSMVIDSIVFPSIKRFGVRATK